MKKNNIKLFSLKKNPQNYFENDNEKVKVKLLNEKTFQIFPYGDATVGDKNKLRERHSVQYGMGQDFLQIYSALEVSDDVLHSCKTQ